MWCKHMISIFVGEARWMKFLKRPGCHSMWHALVVALVVWCFLPWVLRHERTVGSLLDDLHQNRWASLIKRPMGIHGGYPVQSHNPIGKPTSEEGRPLWRLSQGMITTSHGQLFRVPKIYSLGLAEGFSWVGCHVALNLLPSPLLKTSCCLMSSTP